jgi:hypothetical protein
MLSVMISYCYAECCYAECRYAECRYAECRGNSCHFCPFLTCTLQILDMGRMGASDQGSLAEGKGTVRLISYY